MIIHQTQPTPDSCMCTCLAMLFGRQAAEVIEEWHDKLFAQNGIWLDDALDAEGIPYFYGHPRKTRLINGYAYLLTVPSLNYVGGFHQVLIIVTDEHKEVFDPAKGLSKYYVLNEPENDNEFTLISWTVDLAMPLKGGVYE